MRIDELTKLAREVANAYDAANRAAGRTSWTIDNYMSGFVGDVGDLSKLVMAKSGYRHTHDVDRRISHELSDCLWSILVIADELGVDLESSFESDMRSLLLRIKDDHGIDPDV